MSTSDVSAPYCEETIRFVTAHSHAQFSEPLMEILVSHTQPRVAAQCLVLLKVKGIYMLAIF